MQDSIYDKLKSTSLNSHYSKLQLINVLCFKMVLEALIFLKVLLININLLAFKIVRILELKFYFKI